MLEVAVIEPFSLIAEKLTKQIAPHEVTITSTPNSPLSSCPDLLLLSPQATLSQPAPTRCKILLAPGHIGAEIAQNIHADWIVSYGFSPRDTITFSSLDESHAQLAILREIVTLRQRVIEPQEIPLTLDQNYTAEQALAFYGGLLLLDKQLN